MLQAINLNKESWFEKQQQLAMTLKFSKYNSFCTYGYGNRINSNIATLQITTWNRVNNNTEAHFFLQDRKGPGRDQSAKNPVSCCLF